MFFSGDPHLVQGDGEVALTEDVGMAGPVAYAYLSAAADFQCSQVVDRTTGIHALVRKADLPRRS